MSETVTIRLDRDELQDLKAQAAAHGLPPATLAKSFVVSVLRGEAPSAAHDGPVVLAIRDFSERITGPDADVRREIAVALARVVDSGTAGAPAAARQLLAMSAPSNADAAEQMRRLMETLSQPTYSDGSVWTGPINNTPIMGTETN